MAISIQAIKNEIAKSGTNKGKFIFFKEGTKIRLRFLNDMEDGVEIHEPDSLEDYSGQFKLRIPRSLHRSLAEHSQREGISMNQYCVYLLSKNDAVYSK